MVRRGDSDHSRLTSTVGAPDARARAARPVDQIAAVGGTRAKAFLAVMFTSEQSQLDGRVAFMKSQHLANPPQATIRRVEDGTRLRPRLLRHRSADAQVTPPRWPRPRKT